MPPVFDTMDIKIIRSARKTLSIEISRELQVIARAPLYMSTSEINQFIMLKSDWIERHIMLQKEQEVKINKSKIFTSEEISELVKKAREVLPERVAVLARNIGVSYSHITIRKQISRWGSCSAKGNLSFNCLLMLCPDEVCDYVIIHELCHLKEMNHSPKFWHEVEKYCPDFKSHRLWLKENGSKLILHMKFQ